MGVSADTHHPGNSGSVLVLFVDDNSDIATVVSALLERESERISVKTATCASEGLEQLAEADFDCVISDYDMPGQNGIDFLNAVREAYPDLPFILFTGRGSEEVASDAISAGVTDYLQKQSGTDQYALLANRIENAVERTESEKKLRVFYEAVEATGHAIYVTDRDGTIEYVNPAFVESTGYSVEEAVGENPNILQSGEYEREFYKDLWETILAGETWRSEMVNCTKSGNPYIVDQTISPVEKNDGEIEHFIAVNADITQRRMHERALERYERIIEHIPVGVYRTTPGRDGNIVFANRALVDILDAPSKEAIYERSVKDFYADPDEREIFSEKLLESEVVTNEQVHMQTFDDEEFWAATSDRVVETDGEIYFEGAIQDVTERKRREDELQELSEEYDAISKNAEDAISLIEVETTESDMEFRFERLNPVYEAASGLTTETVRGKTPREVLGDDHGSAVEANYRRCVNAREPITYEEERSMPEGTIIWQTKLAPVITDGDVTQIVGIARDMTDHLERERKLQHKNAQLEEFASIVSHDLRNPLNVALGRLEMAQKTCESEHLDEIEPALERMEALIEDLLTLALSGTAVQDVEPVELPTAVNNCWRNVETSGATLIVDTDQTICGSPGRLQQVLENLFRNAIEHGGADVTVKTGDLDDGFYIEDDGAGIPAEERGRVFEAGYSSTTGGTGLGLSILRQVADEHGWEIDVAESSDGGARFEITNVTLL